MRFFAPWLSFGSLGIEGSGDKGGDFLSSSLSRVVVGYLRVAVAGVLMRTHYRRRVLSRIVRGHAACQHTPAATRTVQAAPRAERRWWSGSAEVFWSAFAVGIGWCLTKSLQPTAPTAFRFDRAMKIDYHYSIVQPLPVAVAELDR